MKTMNSKMTTNLKLSTKPKKNKNELSKQLEQNRIREMEITWRIIHGEGEGENGAKGTGNKKHKW